MIINRDPEHYLDSIHYKRGHILLRMLRNEGHCNMIIYGVSGCGKTSLVKLLLNELFGDQKCKVLSNNNFKVCIHKDYYYFDCSEISSRTGFINYMNDVLRTHNHFNGKPHYIILDNYTSTNRHIQLFISKMLEKPSICRILIISDNYHHIIHPVKSRCCLFRIPEPSTSDKYTYLNSLIKKENIIIDEGKLYETCKTLSLHNFSRMSLDTPIDVTQHVTSKILHIMSDSLNISKVKKYAFRIKELSIPVHVFLTEIYKQLVNKYQDDIDMYKVCHVCAEYDLLFKKSYRDIIYLESFLIELVGILHEGSL